MVVQISRRQKDHRTCYSSQSLVQKTHSIGIDLLMHGTVVQHFSIFAHRECGAWEGGSVLDEQVCTRDGLQALGVGDHVDELRLFG